MRVYVWVCVCLCVCLNYIFVDAYVYLLNCSQHSCLCHVCACLSVSISVSVSMCVDLDVLPFTQLLADKLQWTWEVLTQMTLIANLAVYTSWLVCPALTHSNDTVCKACCLHFLSCLSAVSCCLRFSFCLSCPLLNFLHINQNATLQEVLTQMISSAVPCCLCSSPCPSCPRSTLCTYTRSTVWSHLDWSAAVFQNPRPPCLAAVNQW